MARQIVMSCDAAITARIKDCGEAHDDTRTFLIRVDGEAWEIDLGGEHAQALLDIARRGREAEGGGTHRGTDSNRGLERRIRGVPPQ